VLTDDDVGSWPRAALWHCRADDPAIDRVLQLVELISRRFPDAEVLFIDTVLASRPSSGNRPPWIWRGNRMWWWWWEAGTQQHP